MESMTAPAPPVTVGVDTHLDLHVAAVVDQTGRLLRHPGVPGLDPRLCRAGHLG